MVRPSIPGAAIVFHQTSLTHCCRRSGVPTISFYVESLWFGSLGFESVYWYQLKRNPCLLRIHARNDDRPLADVLLVIRPREARGALMELNGGQFTSGLTRPELARPVPFCWAFAGIRFQFGVDDVRALPESCRRRRNSGSDIRRPSPSTFSPCRCYRSLADGSRVAVNCDARGDVAVGCRTSARFRGVSIGLAFVLAAIAFQTFLSNMA